MLRSIVTSILVVVCAGCATPRSPQDENAMMEMKIKRREEAQRARGDSSLQASLTCKVCGGTYAQAGNCPKCGLELTPK